MPASTPTAADLTADAIAVAAQQPAKGEVDGVKVEAVSIPDQELARRIARTEAALAPTATRSGSGWGALRTARVAPPGATG